MQSMVRFTLLFLLFCFTSFPDSLYSQTRVDANKLDRYFTALTENNRFMGSVFIMKDDQVLFNNAYGIRNAGGTPASPGTKYRIGSITKSYTATMILQLTEQGKLTLNTTLDQFFPQIPNSEYITIEHLLRHQSGLVNFTNLGAYMEYYTEPRSREEHLSYFEEIGTSFEPGTHTEYSNTAYVFLGFIIEELTGMGYGEALQEMITEPLGLRNTYAGHDIDPSAGEAHSFTFTDGEWAQSAETDLSVPRAAGSIVSTAEETSKFYNALFSGMLLEEETFNRMVSFEGPFGLGLIRFPFHDKYLFGHNGGIDGYQSNSAHDPETTITFAILGNGISYNFNDILIGLLSITYGMEYEIPDFEERQPITLSEEQLESYTGTYTSPEFPLKMRLFIDGNNLMAQATGQGAFPLTIYEEQIMAFEQAGIEIIFEEKNGNRYQVFTLNQSGMSYRFSLEVE